MRIVEGHVGGVNRYLSLLLLAAACHLGRPPAQPAAVSLGGFRVASAEPGLEDALREGLVQALMGRSALDKGGPLVTLEVRSATTRPVAVGGGRQVHTARLEIAVSVGASAGRTVVLADERSYGLGAGTTLDAAAARARAFQQLAQELSDQAATWIVYAPPPESP